MDSIIAGIATVMSADDCWLLWYQPETPDCLK